MVLNPYDWWVPLLAVFGIAVVAPAWTWFLDWRFGALPIHVQFLATLTLPVLAALLIASWVEPV